MKNKYLLLVLLANMFSFTSFGQIPGYLGKRFIIHANVNSMLAYAGPTAANKGIGSLYEDGERSFALSNRFELQGEYAISRKNSISIGASYFKTGLAANINTKKLVSSNFYSDVDRHSLFYNLSSFGVNLGISGYATNKGALAPMGKYRTLSFWARSVNGKILDKKTTYADDNVKTHGKIIVDPKFIHYGIALTSSENRIFIDKLVLNIGWQISIPFDILSIEEPDYYGSDGTLEGNQTYYNNAARFRLRNHDFLTMKIGFGYLAF